MLIAADWGTTHLRAWLFDSRGHIVARRDAPLGISRVPSGGFQAAWAGFAQEWLGAHPHAAVLLCGMVGARQGWQEVPYMACPATLADLSRHLHPLPDTGGRVGFVVPGLRFRQARHIPDVMRGEETFAIGCLQPGGTLASDSADTSSVTMVLPGTHSKWLDVEQGHIVRFETHMTGEVYALMRQHSILSRLLPPPVADDPLHREAFDEGVVRAVESGDSILHTLFAVRTLALFDELETEERASYLSGLLIGEELRTRLPALRRHERTDAPAPVTVAASVSLTERYTRALALFGVPSVAAHADACALGLWAIATEADLT